MPYIGNTIRAADDYRLIDDISSSFNGSTTSFALQVAGSAPVPFPKSPQQVLISVNGVIQEPDPSGSSGFNLVGTNIVFSSAPTNGHAFFGIIYATADYLNAGGNFPAGSLGAPSITFIGDENTGLYRKGGGSIGFVADATEIANTDSNGLTISSGNLIIPDSIIHSGDTNTKIRFPAADTFSVETGGAERLSLGTTTVFNDTGADVDFRIEGDTRQFLFNVDATNDRIGIDRSSPDAVFHIFDNPDHGNDRAALKVEAFRPKIRLQDRSSSSNSAEILCDSNALRFNVSVPSNDTTNLTERLRIDSSGRVGIGTSSPTTSLHVQQSAVSNAPSRSSALYLENNANCEIQFVGNSSNDCQLRFGTSSNSFKGAIEYELDNNNLEFVTNGSERLRIDSSGRVMIGTTTEGYSGGDELTVATSNDGGITIRTGTGSGGILAFSDGTSGADEYRGYVQYQHNNDALAFGSNAVERMRIDSSGNVGIGVTSPTQRLEVDGIIKVGSYFQAGASGTATYNFHFGAEGNGKFRLFRGNYGAGSEVLDIDASNNFGIGTPSPAAKVHIVGSELRHENASIPFIRLKSTNAQGSNHGDYGRILNDVAGSITGLIDWKRQGATDDSYFTVFNKQSATAIQERLRITSKGALLVHAGQQTNLNNMNKDEHSMPKFFENTTSQDSNLVGADIHFKSIVRGTSGTNDTLFTFSGGGNCGFFCEITAYFSSAIGDFQGRQRMWWRAFRTGHSNFNITQAHNYDKVGSATNVYFNPTWTSSGSGSNQVLGVNVQSTNMGAYVRFWFVARIIAHDSIGSMTINR